MVSRSAERKGSRVKETLTGDYVRDVARSAQGIAITQARADAVAAAIGPFNRAVRAAAKDLAMESEPASHLIALEASAAARADRS